MTNSATDTTYIVTRNEYSDDSVLVSPLSLYSSYEKIDVEIRAPHSMPGYHWHGQVEVNIPFGDDVEYIVNGSPVVIESGAIGLFWASVPHRLTNPGSSHNMGIINIPIHQFMSWPLSRELVNQITHGCVLQSKSKTLVSEFELTRWAKEINDNIDSRQQLAVDEIGLMLRRVCLDGWKQLVAARADKTAKKGVSKHSQFYVSQMLEYIATHHNMPLTTKAIAEHVGLHANYAMNVFQRTMQMTIKQYITAMRINHARALLSDTDRSILDIALTVGFNSSSRFYETFQTYIGVTPSQYRKLAREDHRWNLHGSSPLYDLEKGACDGKRPVGVTNHYVEK
ncbi:DNA-binding transcriptional regulator MelR [Vibrio orientalis CIP 102891 = ATCC 33934]|uniref:DNA-binding transcriptional regulator MelR n=1 Tax=Vibrio orientalis CIP 102891 = ATCC 33934 TaxID=675816 RepID=C9QHC9_VIBOR|nr:transcriptional regulator MelR [Vibrio orientalis]EEX93672.1 melibiose operon regulatory protein [Vibrio orientalis CIP 102891 = ATCC 33934]EGU51155.1 DNA-binding transcriptional regulator MelR [Vibrio orientalis CIP 102891 = ATCC 33934]